MSQKFDFSTIENFDNHIGSSILGFELIDILILSISEFFINENSERAIIDLGCTSGRLCKKVHTLCQERNIGGVKIIGYDKTDHNFIQSDGIELRKQDITEEGFIIPKAQIVYSIFTLQFLPYEKRKSLLFKIFNSLNETGSFIFFEKEICKNGKINDIFTFANYDNKKMNFTPDEILRKEKDLRTQMHCLTPRQNEELLRMAGFSTIEMFFKSLNFTGYICLK